MKSLSTALSGVITDLKEALVSFVYPSDCIHCRERVQSSKWLCPLCAELIEFSKDKDPLQAKTLEPIGPALSFLKAIDGPIADKVAESMAAFMVLQLTNLEFGPFDLICPFPDNRFNTRLAKYLSQFLTVPVVRGLKSSFFFGGYGFKKTSSLSEKKILIVGATLPKIEDFGILEEGGIEKVFYLSFV